MQNPCLAISQRASSGSHKSVYNHIILFKQEILELCGQNVKRAWQYERRKKKLNKDIKTAKLFQLQNQTDLTQCYKDLPEFKSNAKTFL